MDSLASRLERLTAEQRKSVEDYIDFLLSRTGLQNGEIAGSAPHQNLPDAPPPLLPVAEATAASQKAPEAPQESSRVREIAPAGDDSKGSSYLDYGLFEGAQKSPPSPADEAVERVKKRLSEKKEEAPADNLLEWVE